MSHERSHGNLSPVSYVLETTSNSSSQLSEGGDQNTLFSSSSSSPSLAGALRNFEISSSNFDTNSSAAREHSRDVFGYSQDDSSTHMESYMEYLALLNHRHAQEPVDESSGTGGSDAVVATNESLSLLTNTTNSLPFGIISSTNDENGDRDGDGSNHINESENNNDITTGSSTQLNEFSDVELTLIRDLYSPSASDSASSNERRESAQSEGFANGMDETPRTRRFRAPHLVRHDQNSNSRTHCPQPLKLPTSTRLKITVLKWNVAASWKWTAGDETCGICRMPFEACCIECKTPGDECPLALGTCKHAFHMHCIVKWIETQNAARPQCPLCRQEWKFAPG